MADQLSSIRVRYDTLRELNFLSVVFGAWVPIGSAFQNPVRLIKIMNRTDAGYKISFDGINAHDVVPAEGYYVYDYTSNKSSSASSLEQPIGDRVYVTPISIMPTQGNIYVTVVYAAQN